MSSSKHWFERFIKWREAHISNRQFVLILSLPVEPFSKSASKFCVWLSCSVSVSDATVAAWILRQPKRRARRMVGICLFIILCINDILPHILMILPFIYMLLQTEGVQLLLQAVTVLGILGFIHNIAKLVGVFLQVVELVV